MESNDLTSSMSVFDPRHLPHTKEDYGMEKMRTLINIYSVAQRNEDEGKHNLAEETESEWKLFRKLFRQVIFIQYT